MSTDEGNIGGQSAAADSADSQNGRPAGMENWNGRPAGMESWNGRPEGIGRALPPLPLPPPPRASGWFARGFLLVLGMGVASLLLLTVGVALIVALGVLGAGMSESGGLEPESHGQPLSRTVLHAGDGRGKGEVAVVDVCGVIGGQEGRGQVSARRFCELLKAVAERKEVKAIVLDMDTPGGEVTAADEMRRMVVRCRQELKMPVVTRMGSMGASGGYYIASGTDWIVANRMTFTGSIGVIMSSVNCQGLGEKLGLRGVVIKSGAMKDAMSPLREMTEGERAYMQGLVDETFMEFAKVVAEGRERYATAEDVRRAEFGDGRVLSGAEAFRLGLVDELGSLDEAIAKARELSGCDESAPVVRYRLRGSLYRRLLEACSPAERRVEVRLGGLPAATLEPGRMYFIMPEAASTGQP